MSGGDRAEFLDIWQQHVTRPGSEKLLDWLDKKPDFFMQVSTGSIDNIKPEFVLQAIYEKCGLDYNPLAIQIHRQEVYARKDDGTLICLLDMGEEIS